MTKTNPSYTVEPSFSAVNISTAASVYQFTAAADEKVQFIVKLTNAAGNGDYIIYLTRQWEGAGAVSVALGKTTFEAASGETVIEFSTMQMQVKSGDVIEVMIDGLAGDTSVNGNIRIVADNPSVLEQDDILSDATPFDGVNVDALISSRATPADVDLTVGVSATEAAAVVLGRFPVYQSYTFEQALTSTLTEDLSSADKIYCSIKEHDYELDASSIAFIEETAGLTILNKAAYATVAHGSLTLTGSSGAWVLTLKIEEQATDLLEYFGSFNVEFKALFGDDTVYISGGKAPISRRYVRAIT